MGQNIPLPDAMATSMLQFCREDTDGAWRFAEPNSIYLHYICEQPRLQLDLQ